MLHHFLTGSEKSRAAVIQLANWVIDMDDGRKSRFRWIDRRDTGLASVTRAPAIFHGPGRGAGNSINALIDAHRLTGEPRFLDKAEALIARCVHPDDDPEAINPLDAENRWSYTVFLQALGKYLEYRAERGLVDAKFEYARAVLLNYAMWMCAHERPYLDTPEQLEYPTETWAAQDIRKAAVFEFAARHTRDEGARACFLARADGFVDYAVAMLAAVAHRPPDASARAAARLRVPAADGRSRRRANARGCSGVRARTVHAPASTARTETRVGRRRPLSGRRPRDHVADYLTDATRRPR